MARSYPADTKLQHFLTQNYERENIARLQFYLDNKRGGDPKQRSMSGSGGKIQALPTLNPMQFARNMRKQEQDMVERMKIKARETISMEEMKPVKKDLTEKLYDGFSKEEKGRYQYLKDRHRVIPEEKYPYRYLSSWEYGWRIGEEFQLQRPKNARSKKIQATFYSNNGIPDLGEPTSRLGAVKREHTVV